jgi:hypothetical protein
MWFVSISLTRVSDLGSVFVDFIVQLGAAVAVGKIVLVANQPLTEDLREVTP